MNGNKVKGCFCSLCHPEFFDRLIEGDKQLVVGGLKNRPVGQIETHEIVKNKLRGGESCESQTVANRPFSGIPIYRVLKGLGQTRVTYSR